VKVLVVGSGGREHALAWRLGDGRMNEGDAKVADDREVIVCPGNAGIAREFRCEPPRGFGIDGIVQLAKDEKVDFAVIGPEQFLVDGLVDSLARAGIPAFGPNKEAARLEGSKAFMKSVCARAGVATAGFVATSRLDEARRFIDERARSGKGVVVKADGLCAGKGVIVCKNAKEAVDAARDLLGGPDPHTGTKPPRFGDASRTIVVEDFLPGDELSVFAICDGNDAVLFGAARDHKRLKDGDQGPNTGGMGAVAPLTDAQGVPAAMLARIRETVFLPVLDELRARGAPFRGLLFAGLMVHDGEVRVLEFNVRWGDPETEALMVATRADLLPLLFTVAKGERLERGTSLDIAGAPDSKAAVVVVAAEGYPDNPAKGAVIEGLDDAERCDGVKVFCAGVHKAPAVGGAEERLLVGGGRVLAICGQGATFAQAIDRAYVAVDKVRIAGAQVRRDIGRSVR
jgi:phosphoribosylamine---glycine ligase